jgi:Collagen triple helix repeat (20 copies)
MLRRLSYANVTATLALVFAMSGGALAANHYLINSTKQINPKVLKKLKGEAGKTGPPGSQGSAGAVGAQGPAGGAGPRGETGPKGETGPNGETGPKGEAGLSALSTLPAGQSESGEVAAVGSMPNLGNVIEGTVTFPVPLHETLNEAHVIFTKTGTPVTHCSGQGNADPGYLCIYVTATGNVGTPLTLYFETSQTRGAGRLGFAAFWPVTTAGIEAWAEGTWTVTAG